MSIAYDFIRGVLSPIVTILDDRHFSEEEKAEIMLKMRNVEANLEIASRSIDRTVESMTNHLLTQIEFLINYHRQTRNKEISYYSLVTCANRLSEWLEKQDNKEGTFHLRPGGATIPYVAT